MLDHCLFSIAFFIVFANEIKATIEKRTKYPINGLSPLLTLKGRNFISS
nr:hypothetical protein [Mycoplasmopsis bovis]